MRGVVSDLRILGILCSCCACTAVCTVVDRICSLLCEVGALRLVGSDEELGTLGFRTGVSYLPGTSTISGDLVLFPDLVRLLSLVPCVRPPDGRRSGSGGGGGGGGGGGCAAETVL